MINSNINSSSFFITLNHISHYNNYLSQHLHHHPIRQDVTIKLNLCFALSLSLSRIIATQPPPPPTNTSKPIIIIIHNQNTLHLPHARPATNKCPANVEWMINQNHNHPRYDVCQITIADLHPWSASSLLLTPVITTHEPQTKTRPQSSINQSNKNIQTHGRWRDLCVCVCTCACPVSLPAWMPAQPTPNAPQLINLYVKPSLVRRVHYQLQFAWVYPPANAHETDDYCHAQPPPPPQPPQPFSQWHCQHVVLLTGLPELAGQC